MSATRDFDLTKRAMAALEEQSELGRRAVALIRRLREHITGLKEQLEVSERQVRDQARQIEKLGRELAELKTR
jgi:phage shock protein A